MYAGAAAVKAEKTAIRQTGTVNDIAALVKKGLKIGKIGREEHGQQFVAN